MHTIQQNCFLKTIQTLTGLIVLFGKTTPSEHLTWKSAEEVPTQSRLYLVNFEFCNPDDAPMGVILEDGRAWVDVFFYDTEDSEWYLENHHKPKRLLHWMSWPDPPGVIQHAKETEDE